MDLACQTVGASSNYPIIGVRPVFEPRVGVRGRSWGNTRLIPVRFRIMFSALSPNPQIMGRSS